MSLLKVENLKKHYTLKNLWKSPAVVKALDGVSFELKSGETLAIVGESGCGKSTLAKTLMQLESPTEGSIVIEGQNFSELSKKDYYKKIQMIFQDPYSSINPRKKAWQIISEPLRVVEKASHEECYKAALAMMNKVGLRPEMADRYPHMFSGGQRQRIGIARALMLRPKILICDEPVSALDISIQAQVINLLLDIQREFQLSYLFISHDLSVVRHLSDRVLVMYLGKVVELTDKKTLFHNPKHPYTQMLLKSSPHTLGQNSLGEAEIRGELPSPLNPPPGCTFHKRCPLATEICSKVVPELRKLDNTLVSCHHAK